MHQLGLTAADLTAFLARMQPSEDVEVRRQALSNAGVPPEEAGKLALLQVMQEFSCQLLELNNHKIAADLVRLGVLTGSILRDGEASF